MTTALVFHAVNDGVWFEKMIRWLRQRYRLVPLGSLRTFYEGAEEAGDACHITVDDGDRSFYRVMFPILKKYEVPASLFVSAQMCAERGNFWFQEICGYDERVLKAIASDVLGTPAKILEEFSVASIFKTMSLVQMNDVISRYQLETGTPGKDCQNSTVGELQEMSASGLVSIGAHTMRHPILKNEDGLTCVYEITASVKDLSRLLERPVRHFAYPNGIGGMDFAIGK